MPTPAPWLDRVLVADARALPVPDAAAHLIVTSPPYNAGVAYDAHDDSLPAADYLALLAGFLAEAWRVLVPGGRLAVIVANISRRPYIPITTDIINLARPLGFLMRGQIIWFKETSAGVSTAWGSWLKPTNPVIRDSHEYILVFGKPNTGDDPFRLDPLPDSPAPDITPTEFAHATRGEWTIHTASSRAHPAVFPEEIPHQLIKLYTWPGMTVLDPFCGSGTTCVVARRLNRHFCGSDVSENYVRHARDRLRQQVLDLGGAGP